MYKLGVNQRKILLILSLGFRFGYARNPLAFYNQILKVQKDWRHIEYSNYHRSLKKLVDHNLLTEVKLKNGSYKLVLTNAGMKQAQKLSYLGESIKFKKPATWDKMWRIVIFDIPEEKRSFRDILRQHLKKLEFKKLQQSVFVCPYPYEKSILKLIDLYQAELYVKVITASYINSESDLKKHFKLD